MNRADEDKDRFMVANPRHNRQTTNPDTGELAERLELLRLRDSDDPVARAIALAASLLIRRLDSENGA